MSLEIYLPTLNKDWITEFQCDIDEKATDMFYMLNSNHWAFELQSPDYAEKFDVRNRSTDYNKWCYYRDQYCYYKIPEYAQHVFEEHGIWEKIINTQELVDTYHECIKILIDCLAFNVALSWAKALDAEVGEDRGVKPVPKK